MSIVIMKQRSKTTGAMNLEMSAFDKALDAKFGKDFSKMYKEAKKFEEITCCSCGLIIGYSRGKSDIDAIYCEGCMEDTPD